MQVSIFVDKTSYIEISYIRIIMCLVHCTKIIYNALYHLVDHLKEDEEYNMHMHDDAYSPSTSTSMLKLIARKIS